MTTKRRLFLHEEILLLALRDREGTLEFGAYHELALGGAMLAELLLRERIAVDDTSSARVRLLDATPIGEALTDECLDRICAAARTRTARYWVSKFGGLADLRHRVAESLCERGILRADRARVLWLFSRRTYPEMDPKPERAIIDRLRTTILDESAPVDAATTALVSLADVTGILEVNPNTNEFSSRRDRLSRLRQADAAAAATKLAVRAERVGPLITGLLVAISPHR